MKPLITEIEARIWFNNTYPNKLLLSIEKIPGDTGFKGFRFRYINNTN